MVVENVVQKFLAKSCPKFFLVKRLFVKKSFDEESESAKIFLVKDIWPNKILDEKILGSKKFLVEKILGQKNFG